MAQYRTILRMSQGLGALERYRIPSIAATRHDAGRWPYGRAVAAGPEQRRPGGRRLLGDDAAAGAAVGAAGAG